MNKSKSISLIIVEILFNDFSSLKVSFIFLTKFLAMFDEVFAELRLLWRELWARCLDYWYAYRRQVIAGVIIVAMLLIGIVVGVTRWLSQAPKGDIHLTVKVSPLSRTEIRSLKKYLNSYHVKVGKEKGLKEPFQSQEDFLENKLSNIFSNDLSEVDDCDNYEVSRSDHSLPYLVSDAKDFLDLVGERFAKRLDELGQREYRFKVNSLLRTRKDQRSLQGSNPNAAKTTSSHLYGRSFDIAESKYFVGSDKEPHYSADLRVILIRELLKLQNEGKCYIILEDVTNCIHVTVR